MPKNLKAANDERDRAKVLEIFDTYYGLMMGVAVKILRNQALAEDAISEAFIKMLRHVHKFHDMECYQERLYIVSIIESTSIDIARKLKMKSDDDDFDDVFLEHIPDSKPDLLDDLLVKEVCDVVKEAILHLPPNLRYVAYLFLIRGYSHEEIGNILGIKSSASKMRLSRAKEVIRNSLAGEYHGT